MRPRIFALGALVLWSGVANADCKWPPLNGVSQKEERPVSVGGYRFGTAAYSYFVESYRIDRLHCSESINSGPRTWNVVVESGHVEVNGEPRNHVPSGRATVNKENLPALPALQNTAPLPEVGALPLVRSDLPQLPALPPLSP